MASISSDEIRESVRRILKGADLASLSSKKVRRMLEGEYEADFTERKQEIDDILMKAISEEEDSQNSQASNGKSPQDHSASESSDSELEPEPPKKKAKVVAKAEIKKTPKKKPSPQAYLSDDEGHSGVDDAELAKQLQEEESEGRRSRHRSVKKSPVQKKPKKKREKDPSRAGKSTYSQPCALSADLATIMGTDRMARKDVVKRMWEIVKERKLEDPKNRQFMVCDDELFKVFGKRRVRTFGMMKFLKTHIKDMKDIVE